MIAGDILSRRCIYDTSGVLVHLMTAERSRRHYFIERHQADDITAATYAPTNKVGKKQARYYADHRQAASEQTLRRNIGAAHEKRGA